MHNPPPGSLKIHVLPKLVVAVVAVAVAGFFHQKPAPGGQSTVGGCRRPPPTVDFGPAKPAPQSMWIRLFVMVGAAWMCGVTGGGVTGGFGAKCCARL